MASPLFFIYGGGMDYVSACNICLAVVGESPITDLNSPNPSLGLVRNYLDEARLLLLSRRWWFNDVEVTLQPAVDGVVHVPYKVLDLYSPDEVLYSVRTQELFDIAKQSKFIGKEVTLRLSLDMSLDLLPEVAAQWVAYTAASSMYADDLGVDQNMQSIQARANSAWSMLHTQELRQRRYSTNKTKRMARIRSALIT